MDGLELVEVIIESVAGSAGLLAPVKYEIVK